MSLDGFVAGKNDDISWLFRYNDVDYGYNARVGERAPGAYLCSFPPSPERRPQRDDVIFTAEDIAAVLRKAKRLTRKNVWIEGGANVAQQFLDRGLIDEVVLSIVPVILGDGIRLFGKTRSPIELSLRETRTFEKGLVQLMHARE